MAVADRIDLTNIEGSMTNIIHNNADRLYTAQTVRELYDILLSIFRENNLDTNASRRLLSRVIEQRNIKQGLNAIFNSYFKGANMGRDKEKAGGKPKMFKIDEKFKKIVSEDIEKIEVETTSEEITVETAGDAVKVEIEPKCQGTNCAETDGAEVELDYDFFSDLNPEIDIDDEAPTEDIESAEDEEVVDEGFLGIKTKKEKEKEAKAKAEKEAQKQRDKELKDQEERARQQSVADSWARYDRAARDAKAEYNRSSSSQSSKVSNTGKAGVYYSGGDYYSEDLNKSESIKESNDINPDIWKAIGRHFDYVIAEKAAEILENLADRALMQDNVEDTYEAVTRAIDDGLFNNADIWEINALYDECELSDNAYSCLIEDLVQIVDTVRTGDLNEGIEKKYVKPLKDKINACRTKQDLDEIGAYLDDFSDKDIDRILSGKVSNKDINKMFSGYNFVDDDFPGWDFTEGLENTADNLKGYKVIKKGKFFKVADDNGVELDIDFESDDAAKDYIATISDEDLKESKSIKESLSVAEFIDWHETTNYKDNENTFEAVYSILDKYPDSENDVKAQYTAASDEDKEAISRIIDKANETATEEPTVYLARAMHKMYVDGYNYQEIADALGAPVSLVIKMIGSDSYNESLTESTEDKLTESIDIEQYRTPERECYETVRAYTVYLPTPKGKQEVCIGIEEYDDGQYQAFCNDEGSEFDHNKFNDYLMKNHYYNWNVLRDDADDCLEDVETLIDDFVSMDEDDISKLLK